MIRIAYLAALFLCSCDAPGRDAAPRDAAPSPATPCTRFGQSCEVSPGKLGTCVQKDDCVNDCFVCQSQH